MSPDTVQNNVWANQRSPMVDVLLDSAGGAMGEVAIVGCTIQHTHDAPGSANIRIDGTSTAVAFTGALPLKLI